MALIAERKGIWDFWAPRYDKLLTQKFVMKPTRDLVISHLKEACPEADFILDMGCGTGQLARQVAECFPNAEITAADYSKGMIETASGKNHAPNLTYLLGSLEELPPSACYDVILSTHAFPYFPDKLGAAKKMASLLKPEGRLLIVQGNCNNLYDALWLFFVHLTVSRARFLSVTKLARVVTEAGFRKGVIRRIKPVWWIPSIYMVEGIRIVKSDIPT